MQHKKCYLERVSISDSFSVWHQCQIVSIFESFAVWHQINKAEPSERGQGGNFLSHIFWQINLPCTVGIIYPTGQYYLPLSDFWTFHRLCIVLQSLFSCIFNIYSKRIFGNHTNEDYYNKKSVPSTTSTVNILFFWWHVWKTEGFFNVSRIIYDGIFFFCTHCNLHPEFS